MLTPLSIASPSFYHDVTGTNFPLIVDDLETSPFSLSFGEVANSDEDLLAGTTRLARFLSDRKSGSPFAYEDKQAMINMYLAQQHPRLSHAQLQSFETPFTQASDGESVYTPTPFPQPTVDNASAYSHSVAQNMPKVTDWSPQTGMQGTKMVVMLWSEYELDPTWRFDMHFGDRTVSCAMFMSEARGDGYNSVLSFTVPSPADNSYGSQEVTLTLEAKDDAGASMGMVVLENFTYAGTISTSTQSSPLIQRKRRRSVDTDESTPLPTAKRLAVQYTRAVSESAYEPHQYGYVLQSPLLPVESIETPTARPLQHPQASGPRQIHRGSSHTPSFTPRSHAASASPQLSAPRSRPTGLSPIVVHPAANTQFVRTTSLASPGPSVPTPLCTPATTSTFNPYAMYPFNKAQLKINGDLEDMCKDWTSAETETGRRLVRFWRSQTGNTINTFFETVAPENRQPTFVCISCIWWEAKQEHYVTSVDTIYLLENLVGGRFTVEEKNRIRRNLEGFKPLTVSKGKQDSEDFFKLIMGFPNPKPRNIEKDVKVFPWKILAHALKKIMGKYSAYDRDGMTQAAPAFPHIVGDLSSNGFAVPPMTPPSSSDGQLGNIYSPAPLPISYASLPPTSMASAVSQGSGFPVYAPFTTGQPMVAMPSPAPSHHTAPHSLPHVLHPSMSAGPYTSSSGWDFPSAVYMESPVSSLGTPMDPNNSASGAYYHHLHATPEA